MHTLLSIYDSMLSWLNRPLFVLGSDHVSSAELLGFVTGVWCVWLTVKAKLLNFPISIANSFFFLILFASAKLYADSGLQIVYIVLGVIGWWQWVYGGSGRTPLRVRTTSRGTILTLVGFVLLATWALTLILGAAHDIAPFWDGLTTALSLAAQWLLNYKRVENWYYWIVADCIYVPLYFVKHLDLTGIVYVLFLALCFGGLRLWKRAGRSGEMGSGTTTTSSTTASSTMASATGSASSRRGRTGRPL
jgi:nicotinamide mononucleotide transporter